jgi:hypothetical protein
MRRQHQQGMILPALALLAALGSLGWLLQHQDAQGTPSRRQLAQTLRTARALETARDALLGYAASYREQSHDHSDYGYLPCPDTDGDGSSETCGQQGLASLGLLPYRTLNLPDLRDGHGECLWYVVAGSFKNNPKPHTLNWDSPGQFRLVDEAGQTRPLTGDEQGLAAAIIIAPGPPLAAQQRTDGQRTCPLPAHAAEYLEALTSANSSGTLQLTTPGSQNNDQIMSLTGGQVFMLLRRRPGYAAYLEQLVKSLAHCARDLPAPTQLETPIGWSGLELGQLPAFENLNGNCRSESLRDGANNWRPQTRYVRCTNGTACLQAGACRGALILAGSAGPGQHRRNTHPELNPDTSPDLHQYLEEDTLALLQQHQLPATRLSLSGNAASHDIAYCLP